ncbi:hypothetical protein LOH54_00820 [Sulfurimonas sp. HSL-3221]|nr:hypothetical protein [Sulfurimonas sp. HSL-3221]UFS62685.1 hypothetical protein LOH54_00820 [Sulfurimonas sp. HSL-3221]
MRDEELLVRPEKLEALRKELTLQAERRERMRKVLDPARKKPWWRRLFF